MLLNFQFNHQVNMENSKPYKLLLKNIDINKENNNIPFVL